MNKNKKAIFYMAVGIIIIIIGFAWMSGESTPVEEQIKVVKAEGYTNISVDELAASLEDKDFTFVNVHIPYIGDIEGTDVSIPFNEIADNLTKLPEDKNAKIVLYCQSGGMSTVAAETLAGLGYTNITNVLGGMIEWQKQGYPLVQS